MLGIGTRSRFLFGASAMAFALAWSTSAMAQTDATPSSTPQDEQPAASPPDATGTTLAEADTDNYEIVVTANKRRERIQDVALAITAVSGDELNERRLIDLQDLVQRVPGLNLQRGSSQGPGQRVVLRGLNTGSTNATVASVLDEVPLTASAASSAAGDFAADFDPYDLARVEVLKGPQGTLYGATSLGGLIKYVTNPPNPNSLSYGFDVGVSDVAHGGTGWFLKGFGNLPIATDTAAVRFSGYYERQPGWIDNELGGEKNFNEVKRYGGRASVLINATPDLTIRGTALLQRRKSGGFDIVEVEGYLDPNDQFALLDGYNKNTYISEPNTAKSKIFSLNVNYDFGPVNLESITSYGDLTTTYRFDNPLYVPLSGLFFGRPNTTITSESINSNRKFNQEVRLSSDNSAATEGRGLEWQLGLFYTKEKTQSENDYLTRDIFTGETVITPASVIVTPPGTPQVFLGDINTKYKEIAGYVDAIYHFSPKFDIEAGARLFHNKQSFTQTTGGLLFFPSEFTTVGPFRSDETKATFAVAPRYRFNPDLMMYGRIASGYRPGGPNLIVPPASGPLDTPTTTPPSSFGADTTVNYELGLKGLLFNNVFGFDLAAFYIDWKDIQVVQLYRRGFTGYPVTLNAGKAVSKGVEWNFNVRPIRQISLGWLGAYTDSALSEDVPELGGSKNAQLPFVPKWQHTLTADFRHRLNDNLELDAGASWAYIGDRRTNYGFDPTRSYLKIPSYGVFNAQAGLNYRNLTIQLYGKNLTDKRGITNYDRGNVILGVPFPGTVGLIRPREIGLRLSGRF